MDRPHPARARTPERGERDGCRSTLPAMDNLIDGRAVAREVRARVADRVAALQRATGVQAGLATILVGEDAASQVYVANKHRACREAGMASFDIHLPADTTQAELESRIDEVCADERI